MLYVHLSLPFVHLGYSDSPTHTIINVQAKKRQMIEQRLQDKLKKETDSVRRAEEAKKEKQIANRKEEELQLKDSIVCTSSHLERDDADQCGRHSINCGGHDFRCFPTSFSPRMSSQQTTRPYLQPLPTH